MGNLPQVPFSFHSFRGAYISFFQYKREMHPLPPDDRETETEMKIGS